MLLGGDGTCDIKLAEAPRLSMRPVSRVSLVGPMRHNYIRMHPIAERPGQSDQPGGAGLIGTAAMLWSINSESCWIGVGPEPAGNVSAT
jgi:hypothetical protein